MSDAFNQIRLGSLITELPKSMLPASAAEVGGNYHFFCSSAEVRAISSWLQEKPAVIMGTGGVASVNYGHEKYAYSTDTWCFRSQRDDVQTKYLFRKIQQLLPKIEYVGFEGSGLKHLRKEVVKALLIDVPKKNVQNKIIEILDTIDDSISVTESLIAKYQKIKAGLMHDLFTRGVTADGKLRPPREQAPELYQETALGWIPREWKFGELDTFAEIHNNLRKPLSTEVREEIQGEYPYYGPTGILDYINEYLVEGEFCLIGEDGDHFLKFDKWSMTLLVKGRFNVNNHAHLLSGKNGASTKWLHAFFMHRDITFHLTRQGAGRFKLNKAALKRIPLIVPTPDEQKEILRRLDSAITYIEVQKQKLAKLGSMKLGLMQDLLTGKVPVKIDEPGKEFA